MHAITFRVMHCHRAAALIRPVESNPQNSTALHNIALQGTAHTLTRSCLQSSTMLTMIPCLLAYIPHLTIYEASCIISIQTPACMHTSSYSSLSLIDCRPLKSSALPSKLVFLGSLLGQLAEPQTRRHMHSDLPVLHAGQVSGCLSYNSHASSCSSAKHKWCSSQCSCSSCC